MHTYTFTPLKLMLIQIIHTSIGSSHSHTHTKYIHTYIHTNILVTKNIHTVDIKKERREQRRSLTKQTKMIMAINSNGRAINI